jgi:hypothetical protein
LSDPDYHVQIAAAISLGKIAQRGRLYATDPKAIELLFNAMTQPRCQSLSESHLKIALISFGEKAVNFLLDQVESGSRQCSSLAFKILADMGEKRALNIFLDSIPDQDALRAIRKMDDASATKAARDKLAEKLNHSLAIFTNAKRTEESGEYEHIACALADLGDDRAVPGLIRIIERKRFTYTSTVPAAKALAKLGDPRGIPIFIKLLDDDHCGSIASEALAKIAPSHMVDRLNKLRRVLERTEWNSEASDAARSLAMLGDKTGINWLLGHIGDAHFADGCNRILYDVLRGRAAAFPEVAIYRIANISDTSHTLFRHTSEEFTEVGNGPLSLEPLRKLAKGEIARRGLSHISNEPFNSL